MTDQGEFFYRDRFQHGIPPPVTFNYYNNYLSNWEVDIQLTSIVACSHCNVLYFKYNKSQYLLSDCIQYQSLEKQQSMNFRTNVFENATIYIIAIDIWLYNYDATKGLNIDVIPIYGLTNSLINMHREIFPLKKGLYRYYQPLSFYCPFDFFHYIILRFSFLPKLY